MATSSRLDVHNPGSPRVVIIGAGPAGTRCAQTLLAA
ncbi:NAD(P)/FAD-dependent oxidoreductase, partial [Pseudomonas syringae group genomosp. 3]